MKSAKVQRGAKIKKSDGLIMAYCIKYAKI